MRAYATTSIKLGLFEVSCKVYSMRSTEDKVSFMGLSDCCSQPLKSHKTCESCGKQQKWVADLKGYKVSKNNIIPLTKEELDTIERFEAGVHIMSFVPAGEVPLVVLDKPYFLEATTGHKVYELIRSTLAEENKVALVRAVIRGNEHLGVLRHDKNGLVLQQIEKVSSIAIIPKEVKLADAERAMFKELVDAKTGEFIFAESTYLDGLHELISKKANGEKIEVIEHKGETEIDLQDSLKAMLQMQKGYARDGKRVIAERGD